jgi:hypothetical protein
MIRERIEPFWQDMTAIVAATGPSLTVGVAECCRWAHAAGTHAVIAVSDAWRLMPWADALYSCDARWWDLHQPAFAGDKWSSHHLPDNDKRAAASRHGLNLVRGRAGQGFSFDPECIHYGANSGFQAVNLALLFGARRIVLVGFDMRLVGGRSHFFGEHPAGLRRTSNHRNFISAFEVAAASLPAGIEIRNATPGSALRGFPSIDLDQALQ